VKPYWIRAAEFAGLTPNASQIEKMERYQTWLTTEGVKAGGIGPGEVNRVDRRHLADSILFARHLGGESGKVWDLGSGVGLPGFPLAITHPGREFVLVDRSGRRVDLMKRALRILDLDNCTVVHDDLNNLEPFLDTVVSRASLPPQILGQEMRRLLRPGGLALAAGSWEQPPVHPGWETIEIPPDVLDHTVWVLMMRRE
jgi:16S rRNA G527 N7-methylase RsmG